jgi:high-affinity iron transporter
MQTVGWLPNPGGKAFDITGWFDWSSWYGEFIRGVFNIQPDPTWLQVIAYTVYVVVILALFLRPTRPATVESAEPSTPSPTPERSTT